MGKTLSLFIAIIYVVLSYIFIGTEESFKFMIYLILPLACIWFSKEMGNYTGFSTIMGPRINRTSSGFAVSFMGWLLLLLPIVIFIVM